MKKTTHPKWYPLAKVTCACGSVFTTGSTIEEIEVEVCSNCHPFFTGQMKFVDAAGRVDAFKEKQAKARTKVLTKAEKRKIKRANRIQKELEKPESLAELRKSVKKVGKKKNK